MPAVARSPCSIRTWHVGCLTTPHAACMGLVVNCSVSLVNCLNLFADLAAIAERMSKVKNKLLVLSGKGGVGKSTFATQLAFALAAQGKEVSPQHLCSSRSRTRQASNSTSSFAQLQLTELMCRCHQGRPCCVLHSRVSCHVAVPWHWHWHWQLPDSS
jgi:hypothetical protein